MSHTNNRFLFQNIGNQFICVPKCLSPLCYQLPLTRPCIFACLNCSNVQLHRRKSFQHNTRCRETENTAAFRNCIHIPLFICHMTLKCGNFCTTVTNKESTILHNSMNGSITRFSCVSIPVCCPTWGTMYQQTGLFRATSVRTLILRGMICRISSGNAGETEIIQK